MHPGYWAGLEIDWTVTDLVDWLFVYLTGSRSNGTIPDASFSQSYLRGGCPCLVDGKPLLNTQTLQELKITLRLPKGTLLSGGVVLDISAGYPSPGRTPISLPYHTSLKLEDIKIPTLIGLNPCERLAKQMIIATVEIDPYVVAGQDHYNELEQIIVKVSNPEALKSWTPSLTVVVTGGVCI
jgi:hypothetical protein